MDKFIFLDRDKTLNVDNGYVHKVEDFELISGVVDGLKILKEAGYKFIVVTNQSGIARGYYKIEDTENFNNKLVKTLSEEGIKIENTFYCPHCPSNECSCRKPKIGMLKKFLEGNQFDKKNSYVIGDKPSDIEFAKNLGINSVLITNTAGFIKKSFEAKNVLEAAHKIVQKHIPKVKIIDRKKIRELSIQLKSEGKKIVTINGSFDIMHLGHIKMLQEAKKQGDILMVGLNSDSSIQSYKSKYRPINSQNVRAEFMSSLECVDYVFIFNETVPMPYLEEIKPDVHINGSEYGKECIESETIKSNGGRVHIVNLIGNYSTTQMINKILEAREKESKQK